MRPPPGPFDAAAHERHHWWRALLLRVAVCAGLTALLWWLTGWFGLLASLAFSAHVIAPVVVDFAGTVGRGMRGIAFRRVQGHFYQFKGHRIRVLDDESLPQRWLALADLSEALGTPIVAQALRRRWPESLQEHPDGVYVLDDTVLTWLREQRSDAAGRLARWVERDVWYPARGRKASYKEKGAPKGASDE